MTSSSDPGKLKNYCDGKAGAKLAKCKKEYKQDLINFNDASDKKKLFTVIFTTFVFLQVFNEINCRKIGQREFNVFERFFHNPWFIAVIIIVCVVQVLQIEWFGWLTRTTPMKMSEWGGCVVVGMTSLLISAILKMTPHGMLKLIPFQEYVNEDEVVTNEYIDVALTGDFDKLAGAKK